MANQVLLAKRELAYGRLFGKYFLWVNAFENPK